MILRYSAFKENHLAPILLLPTELLTDILLRSIGRHEWTLNAVHILAQVCTLWRDTVLASPLFWPELNDRHSARPYNIVLKRNTTAPLRMKVRLGDADSIALAAPLSSRWQSLMLTTGSIHGDATCLDLPTPLLQDVFISISESRARLPLQDDGENLRTVDLDGASLPWGSHRLTGLKSLSIRDLEGDLPSLSQLHTILSSSPELWCLVLSDLSHSRPSDAIKQAPSFTPITLSELSILSLSNVPQDLTDFLLSHIVGLHCTCLEADDVYLNPSNYPHLSGILASSLHGTMTLCLRYDAATQEPDLLSSPLPEVGNHWVYLLEERPGCKLRFRQGQLSNHIETFIQMLKDLPERPFQIEAYSTRPQPAYEVTLMDLLNALPTVTSLTICYPYNAQHLLRRLITADLNTHSWLCPRLVDLTIQSYASIEPVEEPIELVRRHRTQRTHAGETTYRPKGYGV